MKIITTIVACLLALAIVSPAAALDFPDRGRAGVVDAAHVLPPAAVTDLNSRVVAWDRSTGHQLVVATVASLQGNDIATYGYQLGRAWGLGRKGINDGVILLLAPNERKVRIEVGRGLEPDLTDAETSIIIHDTVVPKLKGGDVAGALSDGAAAIMAAVPANAGDLANAPQQSGVGLVIALAIIALLGGIAVFVAVMLARRAQKRHAAFMDKVERDLSTGARPSRQRFSTLGTPPNVGSGGIPPRRSATVVAPVMITNAGSSDDSWTRRRFDDSPSSSSSDSSSSSSFDFGSSSSGFDSGGGDFGGGGSDSSY